MRPTNRLGLVSAILLMLAPAGMAGAPDVPQGVSPGAADRIAVIEGRCPTFIWGFVPGAAFYEVVVYEMPDVADPEVARALDFTDAEEVVYTWVPGAASAWAPESADCLAPGGTYAWFVRAVLNAETGEATEWSAPRLFTVSAVPTVLEVEQALSVLLRYVDKGSQTDAPQDRALAELARSAATQSASRSVQTGTEAITDGPEIRARSVMTATAAIRGEQPDSTGETAGVVGVSSSQFGTGIGAANLGGGPDLVLDGSADGVPDAVMWESKLERNSSGPVTFSFENQGGGAMTLQVDDVEVVTTATDQDTLAGLTCASGHIAKWDGANWDCEADEDTPPRDPGNQLSLSGNALDVVEGSGSGLDADSLDGQDSGAFAGSVHTHSGGDITTGTVAEARIDTVITRDAEIMPTVLANDGSGSGLDADGLDGFDSTAFSSVVHLHDDRYYTETELSTSGAGGAVHWNNLTVVPEGFADGVDNDTTLTPGPGLVIDNGQIRVNPFFLRQISVIDTADDVGRHNSVAIGADGLGLISYYDATNRDLKVAHCEDSPCINATVSTLGNAGNQGGFTSVAIGADDLGLISFYDAGLKVAHCNDLACTSATITTLDAGMVVPNTSVAIGDDGLGLICYMDTSTDDLKVAHCDNTLCTAATLSILDSDGSVGNHCTVTIGTDNLGLMAYFDHTNGDLKIAHCTTTACTTATLATLDSVGDVGFFTAITIGADGLGLITYYDATNALLKVAHCNDVSCATASLAIVDTGIVVVTDTSVAVGSDGFGVISYYDPAIQALKAAHCQDAACTSATLSILDSYGDVGWQNSIAVRSDGVGLISYYDSSNDNLKVAYLPIGW